MSLFNQLNSFRRRKSGQERDRQAYETPGTHSNSEAAKQWWRDAVNGGATRFRLDETIYHGTQFHEPYFHARLIEDARTEDAPPVLPFSEVARYLYHFGAGAILCREGWSADQVGNIDRLAVSFGDVVDFLLNGELVHRQPGTLGWSLPVDLEELSVTEPDFTILLPHQRIILQNAMRAVGIERPKAALMTDRFGNKAIMFNLKEYFDEHDQAVKASALINWFLPGYYLQAIHDEDARFAARPLLSITESICDSLPESATLSDHIAMAHYFVIEQGDVIEQAVYSAAEISDSERRWHDEILLPGTRFSLDKDAIIPLIFDMPHHVLSLIEAEESDGMSFRNAAIAVADQACGVILCRDDWPPSPEATYSELDQNYSTLSLGSIVDFLMMGRLDTRQQISDEWLRPNEYYVGYFTEPDLRLLPIACRTGIASVLQGMGITEPKVALQIVETESGPKQLLHLSGHEAIGHDPDLLETLVNRIAWCLPPSYTFWFLDSKEYLAWPLFPDGTVPSERRIYLDREDEDDEDESAA